MKTQVSNWVIISILIVILLGGVVLWQTGILGNNAPIKETTVSNIHNSNKVEENLVEVFYLPHGPVQPIRTKIEEIVKQFPEYKLQEYNFDAAESKQKVTDYNLVNHTPIAIFIGGSDTFVIDGQEMSFINFPKGDAFIPSFEGGWSYDDLEKVLGNPAKYKTQ